MPSRRPSFDKFKSLIHFQRKNPVVLSNSSTHSFGKIVPIPVQEVFIQEPLQLEILSVVSLVSEVEITSSGSITFASFSVDSLRNMIPALASPTVPGFSYLRFFFENHWSDVAMVLKESPSAFNVASLAVQNMGSINNTLIKLTIMEKTKLLMVEAHTVRDKPERVLVGWGNEAIDDESLEAYQERVRIWEEEVSQFQKVKDLLFFLGRNDDIYEYKFL